tara:strand:+ start:808 stop:1041 length:234 start_codon:yes stop_codon:yes gene_type:complete
MKLSIIGSNQTQVTFSDGTQVFFSYNTPVACQTRTFDYFRTATKWSATTSRHINKWLGGVTCLEQPQEYFDSICANL